MDNDDLPIGRILSRRETLALLGAAGTSLFLGTALARSAARPSPVTAAAACVAAPEMTVGPYFVDEELNRSDIRSDPADGTMQAGVPLTLTLYLTSVSGGACTPLADAVVDIWHANALGVYSDIQMAGSSGKKFLRGYQVADASGMVTFTTIYPGWYTGRAVHIHCMVRSSASQNTAAAFTTQFFFDDALTNQVYTQAPYNTRGTRDTLNSQDDIYSGGGNTTLLAPSGSASAGYAATFTVGLTDAEISNTTPATGGGGAGGPGSMGPPPGGLGGQPPMVLPSSLVASQIIRRMGDG